MILLFALWAALGATLYTFASTLPPMDALVRWAITMAVLCAVAGVLIRSQPLGEPTMAGRLGGVVIRWGFRATQGRLWPSVIISWLVWMVIGAAGIWAIHFRNDVQPLVATLGWASQVLLLFYITGMWMATAGATPAFRMKFVSMGGVVLLLLLVSLFLWFRAGGGSRTPAVLIAAIPLGVSLLYGVFVLVMILVGGKARWN